jgi:mono/diheme cytochrome c family protein
VYGGRVPPGPRELRAGEKLFLGNCSGCHPYGANIVDADGPVRGAPPLKTTEAFIGWIRDPRLDNGARGVMPPFLPSRVSDAQAGEMRRYILNVTGAGTPDPACEATIPRIIVRTEPEHIEKGGLLFQANCTGCHAADSTEKIVGPGLKGILKGKTLPVGNLPATPESIFRQLRCPYEEMPSFAGKLSDEQVLDLIAYLFTK